MMRSNERFSPSSSLTAWKQVSSCPCYQRYRRCFLARLHRGLPRASSIRESQFRRQLISLPVQISGPSAGIAKAAAKTVWQNPGLPFYCLMFIIAVTLYDDGLWIVVPCRMFLCIPRFRVWFAERLRACAEQYFVGPTRTLHIDGAVGCLPYAADDFPS